jgi:hypothetical protein
MVRPGVTNEQEVGMDGESFDAVVQRVAVVASRRGVLRAGVGALAGVALGAIGTALGFAEAEATHFTCRHDGSGCKRADQCCSSICTGKRGKKKCRPHGTGTCDQQVGGICDVANPAQLLCNNSTTCVCIRTTAGSSYCGENNTAVSHCAECQSDADCERQGFPAGSACAPFANGTCAGKCPTGMLCMAPCGSTPTAAQRRELADTASSSTSRRHQSGSGPLVAVPERTTKDHD